MNAGTHPANPAIALRVLARLLAYPDAALRRDLPDVRAALHADSALGAMRKREIEALIAHLESGDTIANESDFVDLFDRGRATSLHLFEHVHGDSRERGPAMVDLVQTYEAAGLLLAPGELPDYLPVLIEFASTQTPAVARDFLGEMAHLFDPLGQALQKRGSPYASVPAALLELAGVEPDTAAAPPPRADEDIDASWAEPPAFAGCATPGQRAPAPAPAQQIVFAKHQQASKTPGSSAARLAPAPAPTGVKP